ncbi:hypothetical protein V8C42DRAFT_345717 [Trichoderma barbatum]
MKLKFQKLQNIEGTVVAGRYQWFLEEGLSDEVISTMNDFYTTKWPNISSMDSTWQAQIRVINKHIQHEKLKAQLKRRALPEKSTHFVFREPA